MPDYKTLLYSLDNGVAEITLNRPDSLNAFDDAMAAEMQEALKNAERDSSARAIILTGAGKGFCAGQDLEAVHGRGEGHSFRAHLLKTYNPIVEKLSALEKPTLAAINGAAVGAGFGIALACDIRYASESAKFRMAFIGISLAPDSGTSYFLPRLIGMGRALELAYTNDLIDAATALQLGLVNRLFPPADLLSQTRALAARLAVGPTKGYGLTKRAMLHAASATLAEALDYEAHLQDIAGRTADHKEGVAAFLEKRKPNFSGK
ncbi:MAG: 2-(1,2-epoxy-1,2-dihydrophenyl)acetyl-CoA isomerase [Chloroflexi bacterium]|nr:2-(1,2-epoxy-1,2-dihydrophenyl)acetyl-CoA isomerase [Chloroflexota bacterium]